MSAPAKKREFTIERRRKKHPATETNGTSLTPPLQEGSGVSNQDLLRAVNYLKELIKSVESAASAARPAGGWVENSAADDRARVEISQIVEIIGRAKDEIAAIKHPNAVDDRFNKASRQLAAIVAATESATHDILKASEEVEEIVNQFVEARPDDEEAASLADDIGGRIVRILEACSFQDITGQRVTKVIKIIEFIEQRMQALIELWGAAEFENLPIVDEEDDSDEFLEGPQLENGGISQDDIDALFA